MRSRKIDNRGQRYSARCGPVPPPVGDRLRRGALDRPAARAVRGGQGRPAGPGGAGDRGRG